MSPGSRMQILTGTGIFVGFIAGKIIEKALNLSFWPSTLVGAFTVFVVAMTWVYVLTKILKK